MEWVPAEEVVSRIPGFSNLVMIGRGGFATVYRAIHNNFDRDVAIKVFNASALDARTVKQFRDECKVIGKLDIDGVVVTYDADLVPGSGHPFLVMELCTGSLAARIAASGPLLPAEVAVAGHRIAAALHAVHRRGVLHRDITPSNILFRSEGDAVLSDFGLSIRTGSGPAEQEHATWEHAAPEVWRGASDLSSDVYGLGSTLYTALTGSSPLPRQPGESLAEYGARVVGTARPDPVAAGVSEGLAVLIGRMLDRVPAGRPDAQEVALELVPFCRSEPPNANKPMATHRQPALLTTQRPIGSREMIDPAHSQMMGDGADQTTLRPDWHPEVSRPDKGKRWLVAGIVVLVLLVAGIAIMLILRPGAELAGPASPATSSGPPPSGSGAQVTFAAPVDHGALVDLSWTGRPGWDYAVVIAEDGRAEPIVKLAYRETTFTVETDPAKAYCFQIQATWDGTHAVQSQRIGIRGANCRG